MLSCRGQKWLSSQWYFYLHRYPVRQYYGKRMWQSYGKRSGGPFFGNDYNPAMYDDDAAWR